jgi:hypothetical protein
MRVRNFMLVVAGTAILGQSVTAQMVGNPNAVRKMLGQPNQGRIAPAPKPASAAAPAAPKPAVAHTPKPEAPRAAKTAAGAKAKPESSASTKPAAPAGTVLRPVAARIPPTPASRRDPFHPLLSKQPAQTAAATPNLPPGKAGLTIGSLHLDGLVRGPNGMIAVVSNPQQRVYFLREGDRVFDGQVLRITLEEVSFRQSERDALGNPINHEVTRRLYPTPGEQR